MGVYKEGKNWKVQVYYKDWQGNRKRKQKRGFRTKGEAKEWERDFLQQQSQGVDIEFGNFLEIYYKDMDVRLRENTMYTKRYIIDLKIKPYFEKKILSEITVADVRAWQNELLTYKDKNGKGYSPTYLKTVNCQLTAIFNYAMRYYNLQDNPCRKAGAIGKSKGEPKDFWMQEEFNAFLETVSDKPETRMAFLLLYWTGMRIGEMVLLNKADINFNERECVVFGKGDKERIVYFDARTKIHLQNYIDSRTDDNPALFVTLRSPHKRIKIGGIESRLREMGKKLAIQKVHPHKFRRTLATMAIDKGMPIEQLQQLLGHKRIDTTLQYAMVKQSNVKLAHKKYIG